MAAIDDLTGLPLLNRRTPSRAGGFLGGLPNQVPVQNFQAANTGYASQPLGAGAATSVGTPDYASLIANDPIYKQLGQDFSANSIQDASQRAAATQKALIQFGLAPDFQAANNKLGLNQSYLQADITPEAQAAAAGNKLSIAARMDDAYKQQLNALRVSLRQRGASRSGEAGYGQQQALNSYDSAQYDATQQLLDYISGVQAAFAGNEKDRARQLADAQPAAAERQAQLNPAPAKPPVPAQLPGSGVPGEIAGLTKLGDYWSKVTGAPPSPYWT